MYSYLSVCDGLTCWNIKGVEHMEKQTTDDSDEMSSDEFRFQDTYMT